MQAIAREALISRGLLPSGKLLRASENPCAKQGIREDMDKHVVYKENKFPAVTLFSKTCLSLQVDQKMAI